MWQGIQGHDAVVERFRQATDRGRIGGTYLFVGPEGVGKRALAVQLAKALLCLESAGGGTFDACGTCKSCHLIDAGNHPDLHAAAKSNDKQLFTIDLLIGDQNHRNREGLLVDMALKPAVSSRKIAIIDDADSFNIESANTLLKTLEEPPPRAVIFLIGTSQNRQLPTIRSRSQVIRFRRLADETVAELLVAQGAVENPAMAAEIAAAAGGSISRATQMAAEELWQFRSHIFQWLSAPQLDSLRTTRAIAKFVDDAGKEAKVRRIRLQQVIGFAVDFYRGVLRAEHHISPQGEPQFCQAVERARAVLADPDRNLQRLDCCLETLTYVSRNANLATLIDWWIGELAR